MSLVETFINHQLKKFYTTFQTPGTSIGAKVLIENIIIHIQVKTIFKLILYCYLVHISAIFVDFSLTIEGGNM